MGITDIVIVTVAIPLLAPMAVVTPGSMFGSFQARPIRSSALPGPRGCTVGGCADPHTFLHTGCEGPQGPRAARHWLE